MPETEPTPKREFWTVSISWREMTRRGSQIVALDYAKVHTFDSPAAAVQFRARALTNNGFTDELAHEVEVGPVIGKDTETMAHCTSEQFRIGMAMVRAALANASGPLAKDIGRAVTRGVDRKTQAAGERVAS